MALKFKDRSLFNGRDYEVILLDSDTLIALINKEDELHQRTLKVQDKLTKLGSIFVISKYIIAETATFLTLRINKKMANRFLKDLESQEILIINTDEELEKLTKKFFFKQKSRQVTYFDCANMAILKRYRWRTIFSFDKHYQQNNFLLAEDRLK